MRYRIHPLNVAEALSLYYLILFTEEFHNGKIKQTVPICLLCLEEYHISCPSTDQIKSKTNLQLLILFLLIQQHLLRAPSPV